MIILLSVLGGSGSSSNTASDNNTVDTSYTQPTSSPSDDYYAWKLTFAPVFATMMSDYQTTVTDLSNADMESSRVDFVSLYQDANEMSNNADSPDAYLNSAIEQLASDLRTLASEGQQSLNNISAGGDATQGFFDACTAINNDITALNDALASANASY